MKIKAKSNLISGALLLASFAVWTALVVSVDVSPVGVGGTDVGFATVNTRFHTLTGVNMTLYTVTDWLGLVPLLVCAAFGLLGLVQLVKRKSIRRVDSDLVLLGVYYVAVISFYLLFEAIPINYRPILIGGVAEASYPSSTTLLVLSVMPTLAFQVKRRLSRAALAKIITAATALFSAFMVAGRLISGVHWLTDIVGAIFLSAGLFCAYKGVVLWNLTKSSRS